MKTWWFPPIWVAMPRTFINWKKIWPAVSTGSNFSISCTSTVLPFDIFYSESHAIWVSLSFNTYIFISLLPFSICLYSLFPIVEFLLALFKSETYFPVHTLFSSNQEKLIAERRIPVLQSQLEEYKSILCQLQAQKYKLQTEVLP